MRTPALALLLLATACERDPVAAPVEPAPAPPAMAPAPTPTPAPVPPSPVPPVPIIVPRPPAPRPAMAQPVTPRRPSPSPSAAACHANPLQYDEVCGGIGPLRIPYPPYMRARTRRPGDRVSPFATVDAWEAALTPAQRRYVTTHCRGGEDQPSSDLCGDNTPLVVAFDDQPVAFARDATARFAFAPGAPAASDWPTATTPWLALDVDHDGAITSGAELFGNHTLLPDGTAPRNGFLALAALDANHDGRIDAQDPAFASLLLWADRDGDRRSTPDELTSVAGVITSISLDDRVDARCDARDNCEGERAALTWIDAAGARHTGSVVDVYVPLR